MSWQELLVFFLKKNNNNNNNSRTFHKVKKNLKDERWLDSWELFGGTEGLGAWLP